MEDIQTRPGRKRYHPSGQGPEFGARDTCRDPELLHVVLGKY